MGAEQLADRPIFRPGEILETVPGLIVTQHSGEGKANQFFLRGFNLDHGTDFATSIDGVPVNLPSHGHGQGYTDLNFLIPELVQRIDYRKGPYSAEQGDFSSAGAANLRVLPRAAPPDRPLRGRDVRLLPPARRGVARAGTGHRPRRARAAARQRPLEGAQPLQEGERRAALQPGRRRDGRERHRVRLRRQVECDRPDRGARARGSRLRALRFARRQRRRQFAEVHALRRVAPQRRRLGHARRALRLLPESRSLLELHLPARQPAGRPVQAVRPALGGRRQRPAELVRRDLRHARPRTAPASSCAATASRTVSSRRSSATSRTRSTGTGTRSRAPRARTTSGS